MPARTAAGPTFFNEALFGLSVGVPAYCDTADSGIKQENYGDRTRKLQEPVPPLPLSKTRAEQDAFGFALRTRTFCAYEYHPGAGKQTPRGYASPNTQYLYLLTAPDALCLILTLSAEYASDNRQDAKHGICTVFGVRYCFGVGAPIGLSDAVRTLIPDPGPDIATRDRNTAILPAALP